MEWLEDSRIDEDSSIPEAWLYNAGSLIGVSAVYTMLAAFSKSATNACASVSLVGLELAMQGVGNQNVREVGVHPG